MEKLNISANSFLQSADVCSNMELEKVAELYDTMRKETQVKKFCDTSKIKYREAINQHYIVINRKQFTGKTRKDLIDKLFEHFCGISVTTLDEAFKEWMIWRRDNGTNSKTLKENNNDYNNYVKGYVITSKRLSNIKSVLNGIMKRCVSREIIAHNILSDVDMQLFHKRCKPAASNKDNYSEAERQQILDYLSDKTDPYALAIKLAFYLPLRISEICSIKYFDINGRLNISRARRTSEEMDDNLQFSNRQITNEARLEGNKETGFRSLPLTTSAREIIEQTHELYPDNEFLFMRDGKQLIPDTFNEQLQKVCNHLGIRYRSSHQIRFTVATLLFSKGVPITELSTLLGHADTAIT